MKNKIKIFRKLVRCASIALLSFSMAGCGADFLDTTPTNNICLLYTSPSPRD